MARSLCVISICLLLGWAVSLVATTAHAMSSSPPEAKRPNILIIVADDLGYTDLGSFGGEISTPNLDRLARSGLRLTNFHSAPTCSPTRAMLFSGTDNHIAGLGNMAEELAPNQKGKPGYEGYLNDRVVPLSTLLRDAGYRTYMTGKWHLGLEKEQSPVAKGFERSYALLEGGAGHFDMLPIVGPGKARYREDGEPVDLPQEFYSSRFYVDKLIEYMEADRADNRPFFAYLSFTAPHWPLQAPEESIAKYQGKYDAGYDELYRRRMKGLVVEGLIKEGIEGWPRYPEEPAWNALSEEERKVEARKMEIFAAMVDDMDVYTGRLLDYLEQTGQREDTLIIFMSDNGAEGHHVEVGWPAFENWVRACCDNSYENMGKADSFVWYGPNWGRAGSGPYRDFKGFITEGGIRVPAFIHYSGFKRQASISDTFASVMDIMPTLLELTGIRHPEQYQGKKVEPIKGESMLSFMQNQKEQVHQDSYVMGWELFGKSAVRQGDWKIVLQPYGAQKWRLFNLVNDPSEQTDLAAKYPEKLQQMIRLWEQYVDDNEVIIPDWVSGY